MQDSKFYYPYLFIYTKACHFVILLSGGQVHICLKLIPFCEILDNRSGGKRAQKLKFVFSLFSLQVATIKSRFRESRTDSSRKRDGLQYKQ